MNSTALRAEQQTIVFANENHQDFYNEYLPQCRHQDVYTKALIYCIGISVDTRKHFHDIYDIENGYVLTECLQEGWITSGSAKIVRMAFNLYCNGTPSEDDYDSEEEKMEEIQLYTVEDLFCCGYAPYFWQAIKIRYPEYCMKRAGVGC